MNLPFLGYFSRTKLSAGLLALVHALQVSGVLNLSEAALESLSYMLLAAIGAFLRSAVGTSPAGPPSSRRAYEAPAIMQRDPTGGLARWSLAPLAVALVLTTGCSSFSSLANAWATAQNEKAQGVLEDIEARVVSDPEELTGSSLQGRAFEATWDDTTMALVCMAGLDERCQRWSAGTPIRIDKAYLRTGAIEVGGAVYKTYLELAECRERNR